MGARRWLPTILLLPALLVGCLWSTGPELPPTPGARGGSPRPATASPIARAATPAAISPSSTPALLPVGAAGAGQLVVTATIETRSVLRPISPLIYGLADCRAELRPGLCRWGGNPTTRYNWELGNAFNAAADWEFRNGNYGATAAEARAPSGLVDQAMAALQRQGVPFLLTIPAMGWVARDDDNAARSVGVPPSGGPAVGPAADGGAGQHGAIDGYDPSANRARTSIRSVARKGAPFQFPPDLADGVVYQDEWVAHLVRRFGPASAGGVRFYAIDNEPDLWSSTHRDVHPAHPGYESALATFLEYATAIKAVDPSAGVVGPDVSGWLGLFYSALDRGPDNFATAADRGAHDGMPFLPWFLDQVRAHDARAGRRTLDVLAVHWYPQGGEYSAGGNDAQVNARRLRATRQLWDPGYREESWIGRTRDILPAGAVRLIPRLRAWIDQYYPGTQLGITEWSYGADDTLNGALAIADVLGVFGREGVDLAAYWRAPKPGSPGALAFQLYRDYDGRGGQFGDQALAVRRADINATVVSVFASRDSRTGDAIVICVNKDPERTAAITLTLGAAEAWAPTAQHYQYGPATLEAIARGSDLAVGQGTVTVNLPPSTMQLIRVAPAA